MESVYLETTFISYLVSRPSRDVIVAGHQQTTQDWWDNRRGEFTCSVSQVVIDEASVGDASEVTKRLAIVSGLPTVDVTEEVEALTQAIVAAGILPPHAFPDAAHVAVCAVHKIDYLLTWNCKHLANAQIGRRIAVVCQKLGYKMPTICTPEELMGASRHVGRPNRCRSLSRPRETSRGMQLRHPSVLRRPTKASIAEKKPSRTNG